MRVRQPSLLRLMVVDTDKDWGGHVITNLGTPTAAKEALRYGDEGLLDHGEFDGLGDDDHPQYTLDPHGEAQHTDVARELFIEATNDSHGTATLGVNADYSVVTLDDNILASLFFTFKVPDKFVSFTSIQLVWLTGAAAGNMRWTLEAYYAAAGEARSMHVDNPVQGETANGGVAVINIQEPVNPLTMVDLALGDMVGVRLYRDGAHANDTLNTTADILGIIFNYVGSQ